MDWAAAIEEALGYIEEQITGELTIKQIAAAVHISPFYFQKGFSMLCGYTVGEYIRMRRLSLAGSEWLASDSRVVDLAVKYGYDSADSFTRAFTRFHGSTPTDVRKNGGPLKSFAPLHIRLSLAGGTVMEYRIEKKPAFAVMGLSRWFSYEAAAAGIPAYWDELRGTEGAPVGQYGVCFDGEMAGGSFLYLIADDFRPKEAEKRGLSVWRIPAHTWAVFPSRGPMPEALQQVNRRIFSEWLPANRYEIAEGYNVEAYSDITGFPGGMEDPSYYAEVWIPIRER